MFVLIEYEGVVLGGVVALGSNLWQHQQGEPAHFLIIEQW